jgi:peptidoglycan L-alanyl-D-glutamate endopeptidase CwlK
MTVPEQIRAVQSALGLTADGVAGVLTWRAIHAKVCGDFATPFNGSSGWSVDERSAKNISTLVEPLQKIAVEFLRRCHVKGLGVKIICGTRTIEEQDALYAQGRTKPGDIVTWVKGGNSWHNYGLAFDVGVFRGADYLGASSEYAEAGAIGIELGLEWGGSWKKKDFPHFQWRPPWAVGFSDSAVIAQLQRQRRAT